MKAFLFLNFIAILTCSSNAEVGQIFGRGENDLNQLKIRRKLPVVKHQVENLPESFDAREQWPYCADIINYIRDQSACYAGWALAVAGAISDRICIASKGEKKVLISAEDLLSCCNQCGYGCQGGNSIDAWEHWQYNGVVTGGNFNTTSGCRSYSFPECDHQGPGSINPCGEKYRTPTCRSKCDEGSGIDYFQDITYGSEIYSLAAEDEDIMAEIMKNGPVTADIALYSDFQHYTRGIYKHYGGLFYDFHTVKVFGWGVEDGTPYWLVANSWNEGWGEKGFIRMIRGDEDVGLNVFVHAGIPKLN